MVNVSIFLICCILTASFIPYLEAYVLLPNVAPARPQRRYRRLQWGKPLDKLYRLQDGLLPRVVVVPKPVPVESPNVNPEAVSQEQKLDETPVVIPEDEQKTEKPCNCANCAGARKRQQMLARSATPKARFFGWGGYYDDYYDDYDYYDYDYYDYDYHPMDYGHGYGGMMGGPMMGGMGYGHPMY